MSDTWSNLPSGILHGNLRTPGHFDECVKFRHDDIQGQHCMVSTTAKVIKNVTNAANFDWRRVGEIVRENKLTVGHGVCLPASCLSTKVIEYTNKILNQADLETISAICRTNDPIAFKAIDISAM